MADSDWHKHNDDTFLHLTAGYVVKRKDGGWAKDHNPASQRPWAILVPLNDGSGHNTFVLTRGGRIRTFGSSGSAVAAADQHLLDNE